MQFIIRETGEKRQVTYLNKSGVDWSKDIAYINGLFDDDSVKEDDDQDAIIAPYDVVKYWEEYFAALKDCDEALDELRNNYDGDEVDAIYNREIGDGSPDDLKAAIEITRDTLQKRYNTKTAILIGYHATNLHKGDFRYYEELLYWQDTGEFFMVGRGGPMTAYGRTCSDGSMGYGKRSSSITCAAAQAWAVRYSGGPD